MCEFSHGTMQKIGNLDGKKFQELLKSFIDDATPDSPKKIEKKIKPNLFLKTNQCHYCQEFECIADANEGKYICTKCGRDNGEIIDSTLESRPMSFDDLRRTTDPSRVGMPVNEHFMKASLSTLIDGFGYQNYRRYQKYITMDYDERKLLKNFQTIDTSTEDLCPEVVKEHAKNVYKKISENENKRGRKKRSNMAACVFFSSERRDITVDKEKLSESFSVSKKKFTKGCNFYKEQLFEKEPAYYAAIKPVSAEDEIKKICVLINLPEVYKNIICYIAHMAQELGIVIKNTPISIAVGSLFLASNVYQLNVDKKEIIDKCDISDVTINKSLALLTGYKIYLLPTERLYNAFLDLKQSE